MWRQERSSGNNTAEVSNSRSILEFKARRKAQLPWLEPALNSSWTLEVRPSALLLPLLRSCSHIIHLNTQKYVPEETIPLVQLYHLKQVKNFLLCTKISSYCHWINCEYFPISFLVSSFQILNIVTWLNQHLGIGPPTIIIAVLIMYYLFPESNLV